jgi:hypothetical protein
MKQNIIPQGLQKYKLGKRLVIDGVRTSAR